jgi:hypothetical protein
LSLVQGQVALNPPELADDAAGQDEQDGQMHEIRAQGPEAAALQQVDFLVRQGFPADFPAQFFPEQGPDAGVGVNLGGPVELAPLRQGQGRLQGEGF